MKDVVLFVDAFGCGGIEKFIFNVCQYIDRKCFHVTVVAVIADEKSHYLREFNKSGISFVKLLNYLEPNPIKRIFAGRKAFHRYLKQLDKDTILHFNISNSIDMKYAVIAQKLGFKNLIYHSHNSDATSLIKRTAHKMLKSVRCRCAKVNIACSEKAAIWLYDRRDIANKNYVIINNAIDAKKYEYQVKLREKKRSELGLKNELLIGHIGRYNLQKNHIYLIDIYQEVLKKIPESKLLLIGEGDLREQVDQKIRELGISEHVISISQTDEVNSYLQAMDVFVLPSLYEGLPFVLVESQAASLPTVASDTITQEIKITEYLEYAPLKCEAAEWAEKIIKASSKERRSTYSQLCTSGFEIHESIHKLENIYYSLTSGHEN